MSHFGSEGAGTRTQSRTGDSHGSATSKSTPVADMVHEGHAPSPKLTGDLHGSGACGSGASGIGAIGQAPSPSHQAKGVTMGHAPSPSERVAVDGAFSAHPHGSGTGVGSGAGRHTSSPGWRLDETSDEPMSFRSPLGESSRHDGSHGTCRPHGGHHDVVSCPIGVIANGNDEHVASFSSLMTSTDD